MSGYSLIVGEVRNYRHATMVHLLSLKFLSQFNSEKNTKFLCLTVYSGNEKVIRNNIGVMLFNSY